MALDKLFSDDPPIQPLAHSHPSISAGGIYQVYDPDGTLVAENVTLRHARNIRDAWSAEGFAPFDGWRFVNTESYLVHQAPPIVDPYADHTRYPRAEGTLYEPYSGHRKRPTKHTLKRIAQRDLVEERILNSPRWIQPNEPAWLKFTVLESSSLKVLAAGNPAILKRVVLDFIGAVSNAHFVRAIPTHRLAAYMRTVDTEVEFAGKVIVRGTKAECRAFLDRELTLHHVSPDDVRAMKLRKIAA